MEAVLTTVIIVWSKKEERLDLDKNMRSFPAFWQEEE